MDHQVTINGKPYIANKRRSDERCWDGVQYHVVFREKGKRKASFILHNVICQRIGQIGGSNGFGPFGSPAQMGKVYDVKGWGQTPYLDTRAFQYLADKITRENRDN